MKRQSGKGFLGINQAKDPSLIDDRYLQDSLNVRHNKDLSVETRTGFTVEVSGDIPILDMIQTNIMGDTGIIAATDTSIVKQEGSSFTTLLDKLSVSDMAQLFQYNNKLIYSNGNDTVKKSDIQSYIPFFTLSSTSTTPSSISVYSNADRLMEVREMTGITSMDVDDGYIYVLKGASNLIQKYTLKGDLVAQQSYTPTGGPHDTNIRMAVANGFIWVIGRYFPNAPFFYKIDASTLQIVSSYQPPIPPGPVPYEYYIECDGTNIIIVAVKTSVESPVQFIYVIRTSDPSTIISNVPWGIPGVPSFVHISSNGTSAYISSDATSYNKKIVNLEYDPGTLTATSIAARAITYNYDGTLIAWMSSSVNYTINRYDASETLLSTSVTSEQLLGIYPNETPFYQWYDLCSPNEPTQSVLLAEAGNVGSSNPYTLQHGTTPIQYKTSWYDTVADLETTTGQASNITYPRLMKVEVCFDFTSSQITQQKADLLPVNRHRVYRKDGSAEYKLQGTYPIYWELSGNVGVSDTTLLITDNEDMADPGTGAETFYIKANEEIMQVTDINVVDNGDGTKTTTWSVIRARKGTTAETHDAADHIYLYSIIDNTASASLGVTPPTTNAYIQKAHLMTNYKGRLILANSDNYPSRLWYSSFLDTGADEDVIEDTSWYDIRKNDGTQIRAIGVYNDNLFVMKDSSISYLQGDMDNPNLIDFSTTIGCSASKSVVEYYNGLLFLSREGIMYLLGQQIINLTTNWIPEIIASINWEYAHLSAGVYFEKYNEYWLAIPTGSYQVPNKIIVMNTALSDMISPYSAKSFAIFDIQANVLRAVHDSIGDDILLAGQENGHLSLMDSGTDDNGTAISSYFVTKSWNIGNDYHTKFRRIITDLEQTGSGVGQVTYTTDTGITGTYNIDLTGSNRVPHIGSFNKTCGHSMKARYDNVAGSKVKVYNITVDLKPHKIRSI